MTERERIEKAAKALAQLSDAEWLRVKCDEEQRRADQHTIRDLSRELRDRKDRPEAGAMTASPVYQAPIKRARATKAEVEARREALFDIIETGRPMTVRQVFYQATVRGLVEKAESGYSKVQTDLIREKSQFPAQHAGFGLTIFI